jgi:hypothetical protein
MTLKPSVGPLENNGLGVRSISRDVILKEIESHLHWLEKDRDKLVNLSDFLGAVRNASRAETLIELLEGADCGSHGGYGMRLQADGSKLKQQDVTYNPTLRDRYDWLVNMPLEKE